MSLKQLQEVKGIKSNVLQRYANQRTLQRRARAAGRIKIKHNVQPRREPAKTSPPSDRAVWVSSGDTAETSQQTSQRASSALHFRSAPAAEAASETQNHRVEPKWNTASKSQQDEKLVVYS